MRLVITGHKGFIGSALWNQYDTGKLTLWYGHGSGLYGFDYVSNFHDWHSEWRMFSELMRTKPSYPDVVIHCGAVTDPSQEDLMIDINIDATRIIHETCKYWNAKMIYISTSLADNPIHLYGKTKLAGEKILGGNAMILRLFNVWSENEHHRPRKSILFSLLNDELGVVYRDCTRDFIHISDVVDAIDWSVRNWQLGTFDVGNGTGSDIEEMVDKLLDMGYKFRRPVVIDRPEHVKEYSRALNLLPRPMPPPLYRKIYEVWKPGGESHE